MATQVRKQIGWDKPGDFWGLFTRCMLLYAEPVIHLYLWSTGANGWNGAGGDGGNITISLSFTADIYSYNTTLVFDNGGGRGTFQDQAGKGGKPGRCVLRPLAWTLLPDTGWNVT